MLNVNYSRGAFRADNETKKALPDAKADINQEKQAGKPQKEFIKYPLEFDEYLSNRKRTSITGSITVGAIAGIIAKAVCKASALKSSITGAVVAVIFLANNLLKSDSSFKANYMLEKASFEKMVNSKRTV